MLSQQVNGLAVEIVERRPAPHGYAAVAVGREQESRIDWRPVNVEHRLGQAKRLDHAELRLEKGALFVAQYVQRRRARQTELVARHARHYAVVERRVPNTVAVLVAFLNTYLNTFYD